MAGNLLLQRGYTPALKESSVDTFHSIRIVFQNQIDQLVSIDAANDGRAVQILLGIPGIVR